MKNWKRIPENRLAFLMLTAMALFLVGLIIATGSGVRQFNFLVVATMLLNIGLFTAQLLRSINRHAFSFDMMHWLFCLFFLGLAPLAQHLSNTYSWALAWPTISPWPWAQRACASPPSPIRSALWALRCPTSR